MAAPPRLPSFACGSNNHAASAGHKHFLQVSRHLVCWRAHWAPSVARRQWFIHNFPKRFSHGGVFGSLSKLETSTDTCPRLTVALSTSVPRSTLHVVVFICTRRASRRVFALLPRFNRPAERTHTHTCNRTTHKRECFLLDRAMRRDVSLAGAANRPFDYTHTTTTQKKRKHKQAPRNRTIHIKAHKHEQKQNHT
jgi:hypothetical protein